MEAIWHITVDGVPGRPGRGEGFVHASFASQLAGTLAEHFGGASSVHLLQLDPHSLGSRLKIEPSRGGEDFPHVYGNVTNKDVVRRVVIFRRDGVFDLTPLSD